MPDQSPEADIDAIIRAQNLLPHKQFRYGKRVRTENVRNPRAEATVHGEIDMVATALDRLNQ